MNTKEAIGLTTYRVALTTKEKEIIVGCLERGVKYEKILRDLERHLDDAKNIPELCNYEALTDLIKWLKRKYFMKPKPQEYKKLFTAHFADGESIPIFVTVTKEFDGNIRIAPIIGTPEKGGET